MSEICPNCNREVPLVKHHLIPTHKKGENEDSNYIWICDDCHVQVHCLYSNNHLRDCLNTVELFLDDDKMKKFGKFMNKQTKQVSHKNSKQRKRT